MINALTTADPLAFNPAHVAATAGHLAEIKGGARGMGRVSALCMARAPNLFSRQAHTPFPPPNPECNKRKGTRKVDVRLPEKGNSNSYGARPIYSKHLDDKVDSYQYVFNKTLSLSRQAARATLTAFAALGMESNPVFVHLERVAKAR